MRHEVIRQKVVSEFVTEYTIANASRFVVL